MATIRTAAARADGGVSIPRPNEYTILFVGAVIAIYTALSLPAYPILAQFRGEALRALPDVLAPLIVLALFIERAVEVLLTAWRQGVAREMRTHFERARAEGSTDAQWAARARIDEFGKRTQRIAVGAAFLLSLLISMMGVRAIEMLVDADLVGAIPSAQRNLFVRVDIVVTALLLTGGAEGIHKVVSAFTTFMESTKNRLEERDVVVTTEEQSPEAVTAVSVETRVEGSSTVTAGG